MWEEGQPGTERSEPEQGRVTKASLQRNGLAWNVKTHVELTEHPHSGVGVGWAVCNIRDLMGWNGYPHKRIAWYGVSAAKKDEESIHAEGWPDIRC